MRVALLLSGLPRTFKYAYPYLKKYVIDELSPDIFFCGYSDEINGISKEDVIGTFNPTKYFIRELSEQDSNNIWKEYGTRDVFNNCMFPPLGPTKTISQYYNILKTNELKKYHEDENGFKYDVVIRSRVDYYYYRPITLKEIGDVRPNTIYMPSEWDFTGYTDAFAYGDSQSIDKYSELFRNCSRYNLKDKVPFSNESLMKHHIIKMGMAREVIKSPYWFCLKDFKINGNEDMIIGDHDLDMIPTRRDFL
jgi:hypothetical protein